MTMVIYIPLLWFSFRRQIAECLVRCLRRQGLDVSVKSFAFIPFRRARMRVCDADYISAEEQSVAERYLLAINNLLGAAKVPSLKPDHFSSRDITDFERLRSATKRYNHRRTEKLPRRVKKLAKK